MRRACCVAVAPETTWTAVPSFFLAGKAILRIIVHYVSCAGWLAPFTSRNSPKPVRPRAVAAASTSFNHSSLCGRHRVRLLTRRPAAALVTHIIVAPKHEQQCRQLLRCEPALSSVECVRPSWLIACVQQALCVPVTDVYRITADSARTGTSAGESVPHHDGVSATVSLTRKSPRKRNLGSNPRDPTSSMRPADALATATTVAAAAAAAVAAATVRAAPDAAEMATNFKEGILAGQCFNLIGFGNEEKCTRKLVKGNGGIIYGHRVRRWTPPKIVIRIVAHTVSTATSTGMESEADIKLVDVSKYWLTECLRLKRVLGHEDHFLYRPIGYTLPISDFGKFCMSVSQYDGDERGALPSLSLPPRLGIWPAQLLQQHSRRVEGP